jgi:hypothetical protein
MPEENIILEKNQQKKIINIVKDFVENRGFILEEQKKNNSDVIIIYDRKPESSSTIGIIDMFMGRNFLPKRMRIILKIREEDNKTYLNIKNHVMMLDWNLVEDRPRRRDKIRLELLTDGLIKKILDLHQ